MANPKKPRIRKAETSNQLAKKQQDKKTRNKKLRRKSPGLPRLFKKASLPDNKFGRLLSKIGRVILPGFLRGAFQEIKQTTWPGRSETLRLAWAVFVFAIIFSIIVAGLDYVLDKIFRSIILG